MATDTSIPHHDDSPAAKPAKEPPAKQVRRAMAEEDFPRAERIAGKALRKGQSTIALQNLWIQLAYQQGKINIALKRANQAIKAHPKAPSLRRRHARLLANAGQPLKALRLVNQAHSKWPDHLGLKLLRFNLLREMGYVRLALDALRDLRHHDFNNPTVLITATRFYQSHGRWRAAQTTIEHLLSLDPEHRQARLMRLNIAQITGQDRDSPLPALLDAARRGSTLAPDDAAELLQAVKFTTAPNLAPACQEALSLLQPLADKLAEADRLTLLTQAERFGDDATAHRALSAILADGPRRPAVAHALFNKAMETLEDEHADRVAARLLRHIPKPQCISLKAQFAQRTEGAQAALEQLLARSEKKRPLPKARELANLLHSARHYHLGLRYLDFCRRRWPEDVKLRLLHARLLLNAGYPQAARAILDTSIPAGQRAQALRLRAQSLAETGYLDAARAELDKIRDGLHSDAILNFYLRVFILQQKEDKAASLIAEAQRRGQHKRISSGHFTPTMVGNLMTDLSLLNCERRALPPGEHEAALAIRYINAASPVIRRHLEFEPSFNGPSPIPRQVFQYWDQPTPPDAVAEIMRGWRDLPGIDYRRFNSKEARVFLNETFGATYARAFRLANNVAEASDLLRLCYLCHYGGFYVDTDDRLYGRLDALLPSGAGLVCFRESFDTLSNNVIACVPGHPAIVLASEMALDALLARDNETTWSKTGPGLLTRAVARHLVSGDTNSPSRSVAILPSYLLRREIQIHIPLPHKKTQQYWNANSSTGYFNVAPYLVNNDTESADEKS